MAMTKELPGLQKGLLTTELSGRRWFACLGLAALLPIVIEGRKWLHRPATAEGEALDVRRAVAPPFML
jgi:P-type Ca2+ transporter type 2C